MYFPPSFWQSQTSLCRSKFLPWYPMGQKNSLQEKKLLCKKFSGNKCSSWPDKVIPEVRLLTSHPEDVRKKAPSLMKFSHDPDPGLLQIPPGPHHPHVSGRKTLILPRLGRRRHCASSSLLQWWERHTFTSSTGIKNSNGCVGWTAATAKELPGGGRISPLPHLQTAACRHPQKKEKFCKSRLA